jgi:hypothetical protein
VERWFATLTEKQIRRGAHRSVRELVTSIKSYLAVTNQSPARSCGRRRQMRFWPLSPDFVRELLGQDTSRRLFDAARHRPCRDRSGGKITGALGLGAVAPRAGRTAAAARTVDRRPLHCSSPLKGSEKDAQSEAIGFILDGDPISTLESGHSIQGVCHASQVLLP